MDDGCGWGLGGLALGGIALKMAAGNGLRVASVQRAGVVEIGGYNGTICVNQDNLVNLIEAEVEKAKANKGLRRKVRGQGIHPGGTAGRSGAVRVRWTENRKITDGKLEGV